MILETVRLFLGLELPGEIRTRLRQLQDQLPLSPLHIKWVTEENLHLTLHFLGEIPVGRLNDLEICIRKAAVAGKPLTAVVFGLGVFPPRGTPRVIWAGIGKGREGIYSLYDALSETLREGLFPVEDRPYHPHITLGRIRSGMQVPPLPDFAGNKSGPLVGTCFFREVSLFQSVLTPRGAVYTVIRRFPLGRQD